MSGSLGSGALSTRLPVHHLPTVIMTKFFSRRYYYYLILICLGILFGVLLKRIETLFLIIPFLCVIFLSFLVDAEPKFSIRHSISPLRLYEGDTLKVSVEIEAHSDIPALELLDPLPESAGLGPGDSNFILTSLKTGQIQDLTYMLKANRRGRFTCGELIVRVHGLSGMIYRESRIDCKKSFTVYPHVSFIRRSINPATTQVNSGNYTSRRAGNGIEFANIRPYTPGDVVRQINWPRSLRWDKLYVNEFLPEHNADVIIMIDSMTNVGGRELNTLDLCVRAAASLAYSLIRRKDRVGLIDYGGIFRWVPPGIGIKHWHRLMERLVEAEVNFSYVDKSLESVPRRILPPQSLVLALTPLVDERFITSLWDLSARRFDVVVIVPSALGVLEEVEGTSVLNETAGLLWKMERGFLFDDLRRAGMGVLEWGHHEPMEILVHRVAQWQRKVRVKR